MLSKKFLIQMIVVAILGIAFYVAVSSHEFSQSFAAGKPDEEKTEALIFDTGGFEGALPANSSFITGHTSWICPMEKEDAWLFQSHLDASICQMDTKSGRVKKAELQMKNPQNGESFIGVSNDGRKALTSKGLVLDLAEGNADPEFKGAGNEFEAWIFSTPVVTDAKLEYAAFCGWKKTDKKFPFEQCLTVINLKTGEKVLNKVFKRDKDFDLRALAFHPEKNMAALFNRAKGEVIVCALKDGGEEKTLKVSKAGEEVYCTRVCISPDGKQIACRGEYLIQKVLNGTAKATGGFRIDIFGTEKGEILRSIPQTWRQDQGAFFFSKDGKNIIESDNYNILRIWSCETGKQTGGAMKGGFAFAGFFSADSTLFFSLSLAGSKMEDEVGAAEAGYLVHVHDAKSKKLLAALPIIIPCDYFCAPNQCPVRFALSADQKYLAVDVNVDGNLEYFGVWDWAKEQEIFKLTNKETPCDAYIPKGELSIYIAYTSGKYEKRALKDGSVLFEKKVAEGKEISNLAFCDDGKNLACYRVLSIRQVQWEGPKGGRNPMIGEELEGNGDIRFGFRPHPGWQEKKISGLTEIINVETGKEIIKDMSNEDGTLKGEEQEKAAQALVPCSSWVKEISSWQKSGLQFQNVNAKFSFLNINTGKETASFDHHINGVPVFISRVAASANEKDFVLFGHNGTLCFYRKK